MGLYEAFKDALNMAQKADNIELYRQLLDLSAQALNLQEENQKLRMELRVIQKEKERENDVEHHITKCEGYSQEYPYITLKTDERKIRYCAICWGTDKKLVQLYDTHNCVVCRRKMKHE